MRFPPFFPLSVCFSRAYGIVCHQRHRHRHTALIRNGARGSIEHLASFLCFSLSRNVRYSLILLRCKDFARFYSHSPNPPSHLLRSSGKGLPKRQLQRTSLTIGHLYPRCAVHMGWVAVLTPEAITATTECPVLDYRF